MKDDNFGSEIKDILIEESRHIIMSDSLKDSIIKNRKKTIRDKIREFLNREVEIPLIPIISGFAIVVLIIGFPKDMIYREDIRVLEGGSFNIIFRDER